MFFEKCMDHNIAHNRELCSYLLSRNKQILKQTIKLLIHWVFKWPLNLMVFLPEQEKTNGLKTHKSIKTSFSYDDSL